ncbi:MAG TPA: 50S ribosomal protein L30e [Methanosarcinales archaeon]|nr:50S ribosomal protein L30e [Methanosarcinales archaeon]
MEIDLNKALRKTIRSGKVLIGSNTCIDAIKKDKDSTVVLAANCPPHIRSQIQDSGVPIIEYPGMSIDLGTACGKPFTIATMAILDPGDSNIMAVFDSEEEEAPAGETPDKLEG